jgi:hypothetical protein
MKSFTLSLIVVLIFFCKSTISAQEVLDKRLDSAVHYLVNHKEKLAQLWLAMVKDQLRTTKGYNEMIIGNILEFEMSDSLRMQGILGFTDSLKRDMNLLSMTAEQVAYIEANYGKTAFDPYAVPALKTLITEKGLTEQKNFKVVLSQPFQNILRAELWPTLFGRGISTRFGSSLFILFVFNEAGGIQKVYFKRAIK